MKNHRKTTYYTKKYEDVCSFEKWQKRLLRLGVTKGSFGDFVGMVKTFYRKTFLDIFDAIVKEVWLEQQITYKGLRRVKRAGNGIDQDASFGQFTKIAVGMYHRVLTANFCFTPVATYLVDFFPNFLIDNPFKNPEKYKYPYEHVTIDFLAFVYQMENRLELLDEAEERKLSYAEFVNWVTNWAFCYNEEVKDDVYSLQGGHLHWFFIRNKKLKRFWANTKFNFNI